MNKEKIVKSFLASVFMFFLFAKSSALAAVPTCVNWTSISANGCNTAAKWASPRKAECKTLIQSPQNVSLNLSSVGATTMSFATVVATAVCPAMTSTSYVDSRPYSVNSTWTIPAASATVGSKKICVKFTNSEGSKTCSGNIEIVNPPTATPIPTATPVPEEVLVPPAIGTGAFCKSIAASGTTLNPGGNLTITSTANKADMKTFTYRFFNKDHTVSSKPAAIKFKAGKNYSWTVTKAITSSSNTINLNFAQFDRPDTSWIFYMPKPKNVLVRAYFTDTANKTSKEDPLCEFSFKVNSIDPTPTPKLTCVCATTGKCATTCFYDKFLVPTGFSYSNPVKCNLDNSLFSSAPSTAQKTDWCRSYYKTKGDANNDGKANLMDYFYYVSVRSGQKVPPTVNVDFDGDGLVTEGPDRAVIMRSLKL